LLTYPCDITIKVFGVASPEFKAAVLQIIRQHRPDLSDEAVEARPSENGKYLALSITVHVDSKEEIDRIYQDLSTEKHVIMAL